MSSYNSITYGILKFLAAKGLNLIGISGVKDYTPTFTKTGGGAITTNSISGRYFRIGRFCWVQVSHSFDHATGSGTASNPEYSLPFDSDGATFIGGGRYFNGSARTYPGTDVHNNFPNKLVHNSSIAEATGQFFNGNVFYKIGDTVTGV